MDENNLQSVAIGMLQHSPQRSHARRAIELGVRKLCRSVLRHFRQKASRVIVSVDAARVRISRNLGHFTAKTQGEIAVRIVAVAIQEGRSEEHTSELQSR